MSTEIQLPAASFIAVAESAAYTETHVTTDGNIQLYVENGETSLTTTYTVEQAKDLMVALGRVIYLAECEMDDED